MKQTETTDAIQDFIFKKSNYDTCIKACRVITAVQIVLLLIAVWIFFTVQCTNNGNFAMILFVISVNTLMQFLKISFNKEEITAWKRIKEQYPHVDIWIANYEAEVADEERRELAAKARLIEERFGQNSIKY